MARLVPSSATLPLSGDNHPLPATRYSLLLQSYFGSGWTFLIPYLAAYLLYAWLHWPVNPASGWEGRVTGISERLAASEWPLVPSLLHVYWALHATHLILGVVALRAWWQTASEEQGAKVKAQCDQPASSLRSPVSAAAYRLLPWLCLALIFWIPGIYLEWPADPWEHIRRINEWRILDQVTDHSAWKKSSYFLSYSVTGHFIGLTQLGLLGVYYTATCLLLSWQYYLLARAAGLGDRASLVFVLLNALTFGNNIFSFYRYYGLSSSLVAQVATLAAIRIAINHCTRPHEPPARYWSALIWSGTLFLMALNHRQALGIVGLATSAVFAWKLATSGTKPAVVLTVAAAMLGAGAFVFAVPLPVLESLRHAGWFSHLYGFNLTSQESPAFVRAAQILGWIGGVNLLAGIWLIWHRNIVGFLTVGPIVLLALPAISIPVAMALTSNFANENSLFLFQRLLFAVPSSLAIVAVLERLSAWLHNNGPRLRLSSACITMTALLVGLVSVTTAVGSSGARFWHSLCSVPTDLELRSQICDLETEVSTAPGNDRLIFATKIGTDVLETFYLPSSRSLLRVGASPISQRFLRSLSELAALPPPPASQKVQNSVWSGVATFPSASDPQLPAIAIKLDQVVNWTFLSGRAPLFDSTLEGLIISNPSGDSSVPFSLNAVSINRSARYRVSAQVKATGTPSANNYLAIAWYDANQTLLLSRELPNEETSYPAGWTNGDFSYFGLAAAPAPTTWTTYTIDFGFGEGAEIPREAAYFRVGALLNQDQCVRSQTNLRRVSVVQKTPYISYLVAAPFSTRLSSSGSTAARLSGHWSPWQAATDHVGDSEIATAARSYIER